MNVATNIYVNNATGQITIGGIELQIESEKGQANGYASLDENAKLPASQFPTVGIDALSDVSVSFPTTGQVIKFNGTVWTNSADETGGGGGAGGVEELLVSGSGLSGTTAIDTATYQVHYYSAAATANWTPNFRSTSLITLDSALNSGESITVTILATIGSSGYYSAAIQIDGVAVTPKWAGGIVPVSGNTSGIDIYSYTIIKTAAATFTVIASMAQFA
jgi:hypothetical protein